MHNAEFSEYIKRMKFVEFNGFNLDIVDSVGVLISIKLKIDSNHFDALIDHIYTDYFKNVSVEKVYILLETIVKIIILEHYKKNMLNNEIINIEDVYSGETEMLLVDFGDRIGNFVSDSHITNSQCEKMNIGFRQAFLSDNLPIYMENMFLINV